MFVKELHVKQPITKEIEVLKDVEAENSFDFKGFILVKLLVTTEISGKNSVFYFNRNLITKIVPHSLDWDPPRIFNNRAPTALLNLHQRKIFRVFFLFLKVKINEKRTKIPS